MKTVTSSVKGIGEKVLIHDIGVKVRGPQEDKVFLHNPAIQKNIRRGNTIIEYNDGTLAIARKGLCKFFDMYVEYINKDRYDDLVVKPSELNEKLYTLGPVYDAIQKG